MIIVGIVLRQLFICIMLLNHEPSYFYMHPILTSELTCYVSVLLEHKYVLFPEGAPLVVDWVYRPYLVLGERDPK